MSSLFGWDLLYASVEKDVKSNQDVLVCLTHLVLVSKGFKCIGLGESKNIDGNESQSETLPKGWNDSYALRYIYQGKLYNLKGTRIEDGVVINLIRVDERNVAMIQLNSRMVVTRSAGHLNDIIPEHTNIVENINKQLIDKVVISTKTQDGSSQTPVANNASTARSSSNRIYTPSPLCEQPYAGNSPAIQPPIGVGVNDLHPFGPNPFGGSINSPGGGMLFVGPGMGPRPQIPGGGFMPGGIPGGSLPPGARFDPFRPPDIDRGGYRPPRRPDNDEFPPPGFDDMYM